MGNQKTWDQAEKILEDQLKKRKIHYEVDKGGGSFYAPKIDFFLKPVC